MESTLQSEEMKTSPATQSSARTPARKLNKEDLSTTSALIRGCCMQGCCDSPLDQGGSTS
jgi:hypothetical protein